MFGSPMNKITRSGLVLTWICLSFSVKAQRINDFNLAPINEGISVSFNIGPGLDCTGYSIFHCLDSMSYLEIYNYAGICGTSGTNEFRSFTHTSPTLNQVNYYKIQLYPYEVAYNRILYTANGQGALLAYPNPVSQANSYISLRFTNASNVELQGYVCDDFGIKVQSISARSNGNLLDLPVSGFRDGVYLVWLSDGALVYTTKFIVLN